VTATGDKLKIGDVELSEQDIRALQERMGLEASRKATMPEKPELYSLPDAAMLKLPEGVEFAWNTADPVLGPTIGLAKQFAHEAGLSNDQFARMMSLYASTVVNEQQMIARASAAEVSRLGAMGPARVDSVKTFLHGVLGHGLASELTRNLHTAKQVSAYEALMQRFSSQGVTGRPGGNRDAEGLGPNKVDQATYDSWSYAQRKEYAENHAAAAAGRRY
jgi:hypothetical protein